MLRDLPPNSQPEYLRFSRRAHFTLLVLLCLWEGVSALKPLKIGHRKSVIGHRQNSPRTIWRHRDAFYMTDDKFSMTNFQSTGSTSYGVSIALPDNEVNQ
jgi:hypothetical protein